MNRTAPLALLCLVATSLAAEDLRIPAFTAYLQPNVSAAKVDKDGITKWSTDDIVLWGGVLSAGQVKAGVIVQLPLAQSAKLKLTIAGKSTVVDVKGAGTPITVDFGQFVIPATGYQRFELAKAGSAQPDVRELVLSGPATKDAFFNLKPRRNAPSVHLHYPIPKDAQAAAFYNEVTPQTDPVATYYQACGFARGYFGMQVNSPTERRIIFSVWDAGSEAKDRKKVADDNRVKLIAKGDGVEAGDFGNEGTGGHSHLKYMWKTSQTQRFLVTAKADGADATIYSGYFFFPERNSWGLIASFRAPRDGKLLRGLYSFSENFNGNNGHLPRLCQFGNQWIQTTDSKWTELTAATFTTDATGKDDRHDFLAGVTKEGRFYLGNGGFIAEAVKPNQSFTRPASGKPPTDLKLPAT